MMSFIKNGKRILNLKDFKAILKVKANSKGQPQDITFIWSMNHMKSSLRKLGETCKLQSSLIQQEIDHNEFYEDT